MAKAQRKQATFTIIELITVVAIIAILVAMLMPALARSKEKARRVTCLNQARELTKSVLIYASRNDLYFVPRTGVSPSGYAAGYHNDRSSGDHWGQAFDDALSGHSYSGTPTELLFCPAMPDSKTLWNLPYTTLWKFSSYFYWPDIHRATIDRSSWTPSWASYVKMSRADPSAPVFSETVWTWRNVLAGANHMTRGAPGDVYFSNSMSTAPIGLNAGANHAYVDGSAAWVHNADLAAAYRTGWDGKYFVEDSN
jgi:type II secretory pathway pseudopilin PulG